MPEQISQEQIVEVTTQKTEDYGAQLPEHVILRFARFFLPKIQESAENHDEQPKLAAEFYALRPSTQ